MNTSSILTYALATSYMGESLLSGFDWQNTTDLSNGFVSYQSREDANALGLYSVDSDTQVVRLGVDHTNVIEDGPGRPSIRIESKATFNEGLFIADFLHMPPSSCGLWPAFWMYGDDWPAGGELDIIEGANTAHHNIISAHTSDGCYQDTDALFTGTMRNDDCAVGTHNIGCGFDMPAEDTASYGDGFNAAGGGVYAVEWRAGGRIKVWHFARSQIPGDIEARTPDPRNWGVPQAVFGGERCDVDSFFSNMSLVINTNFCGDYGDATWGQSETCAAETDSCDAYVAAHPEAFANAYWEIRYIDAYQLQPSPVAVPVPTPEPEPPVRPTPSVVVAPAPAPEPVNPATLLGSAALGCFAQTAESLFLPAGSDAAQTLETCIETCAGFLLPYAGVRGTECFCTETLDATILAVDAALCDAPCPGDDTELCGSSNSSGGGSKEDQAGALLLTVYGAVEAEAQAALPPAKADPVAVTLTTTICTTATPGAEQQLAGAGFVLVPPPAATAHVAETPVGTPQPPAEEATPLVVPVSGASDLPDVKTGLVASVMAMCLVLLL